MTTIAAKSRAIRRPRTAAAVRSRRSHRGPLTLAGIILMLGLAVPATWLTLDRSARSSANTATSAAAVSAWSPIFAPWPQHLDVTSLERELVRAGYSVKVDGNLDPVTKSALADYLQLDSAHPLSPFLASALDGTVITGLRNPGAWNGHYGLERATKFVERPLTGPSGQLDAEGNFRAP
jgi:hypothetical protein